MSKLVIPLYKSRKILYRILSHHAIKVGRALPKVITRCYTVRLAYCAIAMEDTRYKELNSVFTKQYSDIFSKELPFKLPFREKIQNIVLFSRMTDPSMANSCVFLRNIDLS